METEFLSLSATTWFYSIGAVFVGMIIIAVFSPTKSKKTKKTNSRQNYPFVLYGHKQNIIFQDPFDNFLIYGGTNSGKTMSIGKPLLDNYIKYGFAGFIYDYKDFDLTKTTNYLIEKHNYPHKVYNISFRNLNVTSRTNPISPEVVEDEAFFIQLMDDMLSAYLLDGKRDEWYNGALGILKGVAIRIYKQFPELCTIPHLSKLVCSAGTINITKFLEADDDSRTLAAAFLDAKQNVKAQSSYLSSLSNYLSTLAFDKNIAYVLSGNDFKFNLIDPAEPKLVSVANAFQIEKLLSPIISVMVSVSSRHFTLVNSVPFVYFLDEGTTFKINEFESLVSVLREYLCSFVFMSQSGAKIEKRYDKLARSSIEANFGNQFYGRTKDVEALKTYPLVFGKFDKKKQSRTRGSGRGGESKSQTVSFQKEERYDTSFFTNLTAGQFVGTASKANVKDFFIQFKPYNSVGETDIAEKRIVTKRIVDENYENIVRDIKSLF